MTEPDWSRFEDFTEQLMNESHTVGAAVSISKNHRTLYSGGFGVRDRENQRPVSPETIFGIASVSKSFTALAISQLADEGRLSVDDPVVDHLPEFSLRGVDDMRKIKIRHLLSHTTGLPPMKRRQEIETFDEHLTYLAEAGYKLLGEPGEYFSYCNDTFLLLGAIIQRKTDRLYRRAMTGRILDPLQMNRSTYSLKEIEKFENVSVPYIYNEDEDEFSIPDWPDLGTYEVGGGVRSCVSDLIKYGRLYISEGEFNGRRLIGSEHIRRMYQPVHQVGRNSHYCFGLRITADYHGVTLVEHGGGQPGVSSNFGFIPEKGIAAAVLTNVSGAPAARIWLGAVNTALGLPLDAERSTEPCYEASRDELERFIGVYQSKEGGKVRIFVEDDCVVAQARGKTYPVRASDRCTLVVKDEQRGTTTLRFFFDEDGEPWAVQAGSRMLPKVPQVV